MNVIRIMCAMNVRYIINKLFQLYLDNMLLIWT